MRCGCVALAVIALAAHARAEPPPEAAEPRLPFQASAHGGGECFDGCEQSFPVFGFNLFWTPGRVGALGATVVEYVGTGGRQRTSTVRFGPAARFYFSRSGLIEPYLGLALGMASFRDDSGVSCTRNASLFAQLAGGAEVRITRALFVGGGLMGTAQAYSQDCGGEGRSGTWNTGPSAAAVLAVRVGPLTDW